MRGALRRAREGRPMSAPDPKVLAVIVERLGAHGFDVRVEGARLTISKGGHSTTCTLKEFLDPRFAFTPDKQG